MNAGPGSQLPPGPSGKSPHFPDDLVYRAARMYYLDEATQAEVAVALGTSRPTVSRLLSEARARGIVHIEVREPVGVDLLALADELVAALHLKAAWITPTVHGGRLGPTLGPAVADALRAADLHAGDALLVSSGASVFEVTEQPMPSLPGVLMAPTVGGQFETEAHYQTNEITRRMAVKTDGLPVFLYAPALPGPDLYESLVDDPTIRRVLQLWDEAKCALLGIGAPPATRTSLPSVMPLDPSVLARAVGDICTRPYDKDGQPITFPGSERLLAMELHALRRVPMAIGVAVGIEKVQGILIATHAGYVNSLVTDVETANALISASVSAAIPESVATPGVGGR